MSVKLSNSILQNQTAPAYIKFAKGIQGNILKAFGTAHCSIIFLKFKEDRQDDVVKFIQDYSRLELCSAYEQDQIKQDARNGKTSQLLSNLFISAKGYSYLQQFNLPDNPEFGIGTKGSVEIWNDTPVDKWDKGYREDIHIAIYLADPDKLMARRRIDLKVSTLIKTLNSNLLIDKVFSEQGDLVKNSGVVVEHFGYADGISNSNFFGDSNNTNPGSITPLTSVLVHDPNYEKSYGSYFVFRKLEQNIAKFKKEEASLDHSLGHKQKELAGAYMVGRFENGMPVVSSETDVNTAITPKGTENTFNNFNYSADPNASRCPFHSHIRKMNPRGESGNIEIENTRIITRRSMTYDYKTEDIEHDLRTNGLGLLFGCFQSDIGNQFEFLQYRSANDDNYLKNNTGKDSVIGNSNNLDRNQKYPTKYGDPKSIVSVAPLLDFVSLKGGEYFFAPSIKFLRNIVSNYNKNLPL